MQDRGPIRVLLVDDEKGYASVLCKRLTKRNFEVSTAFSGSQGIQTVRNKDFDVVILDLKMEDMDGIEVLKIFRKMLPSMEIIMLTGHGSERSAREGIDFGAFDYLTKPYELEALVEKIREAYEKGHSNE